MKNSNQMKNPKQLYYFAYLFRENSFVRLILNVEEIDNDYRVISMEGETPNPLIWQKYWDEILIPRGRLNHLCGERWYEMYCIENDPQPFLRKLFWEYKDYEKEAKARLADIENHMKIIAEEALKP